MIQGAAEAGKFGSFVVATLWLHGPWSPLLPAAYEPVLILYGKLYAPWLVALVGTTLSCIVEWINYRVYDWASDVKRLEQLKQKAMSGRFVRLFRKQPFLVTWIFAWSPLPDWAVRIMAVLADYSITRYVIAFWLGRLPKFFLLATIGEFIPVSTRTLVIVLTAAVFLAWGVGWWRRRAGKAGRAGRSGKSEKSVESEGAVESEGSHDDMLSR